MKIFTILLLSLAAMTVHAANPSYNAFNTNHFVPNASTDTIRANTNASNPSALVSQSQLQGVTGATNGMTQQQHQDSLRSGTNVYYGTSLGITGTVGITNGSYWNLYFANGAFLRTNTAAPFDWEFYNTNAVVSYGTNTQTIGSVNHKNGLVVGIILAATSGIFGTDLSASNHIGSGYGLSNLVNAHIVLSGANITITYSTNATTGKITATIAFSNPASVGTLNVTNINFPTLAAETGKTNIVFINSSGAYQTNDLTEWIASLPGGSTPNGLVTNRAGANVVVTNAGVNTTITSNSVTSGTIIANGGTSNYLGGVTVIASNAAPFSTVSPSGLNSIAMNQPWTNNFNRQATLIMNITWFTNGGLSDNIIQLAFTNTITGESYTNSGPMLAQGAGQSHLVFPGISPGDYGSISNYSSGTGGPTVTIAKAWWKLQ